MGNNNNNANNWRKSKNARRNTSRDRQGRRNGKREGRSQRYNNFGFDGKERRFQKFVDTNRHANNQSNYWHQNDRNFENSGNNNFLGKGGCIYNPTKPLISQRINFENPFDDYQEVSKSNNTEVKEEDMQKLTKTPSTLEKDTTANTISEIPTTPNLTVETNIALKIKQEKDVQQNLMDQRKTSSKSSSSSCSSSTEEEPEPEIKMLASKSEITPSSKPPSLPKENSMNSTPVKINKKLTVVSKSSSNSSSSSSVSEEESKPLPSNPMTKTINKPKIQVIKESKKLKKGSEDDVVCIGKLENKFILEDASDNENIEYEYHTGEKGDTTKKTSNKKTKKSAKKATEECMICDKKGHTSFQCQMICKNCSEPYHGYRTCPQPANLNTMLQLFIEFCAQQFQNFSTEMQFVTQVASTNSSSNKISKVKRKQVKSKEDKAYKKRRISTSKKAKSKIDSVDSSADDTNESDTDSETSVTESEDTSKEMSVSSKRKHRVKKDIVPKVDPNLLSFSANPINLPMILNGVPSITVPSKSVQNSSTSTNALNTLLLTQMLQNAISSLK